MEITYLGSGICSYRRLMRSAILKVTVPAIIITSAWRADGRGKTPKRSRSYVEAIEPIISIAQQAIPKLNGHNDDIRAQFIRSSSLVTITSPPVFIVSLLIGRFFKGWFKSHGGGGCWFGGCSFRG